MCCCGMDVCLDLGDVLEELNACEFGVLFVFMDVCLDLGEVFEELDVCEFGVLFVFCVVGVCSVRVCKFLGTVASGEVSGGVMLHPICLNLSTVVCVSFLPKFLFAHRKAIFDPISMVFFGILWLRRYPKISDILVS